MYTNPQLLKCADKLEASQTVMHGSAYQRAREAERCLRTLAKNRVVAEENHAFLRNLIEELTYFASTVSRPASEHMLEAANALSSILPKQGV
jgi:hypothetical protein